MTQQPQIVYVKPAPKSVGLAVFLAFMFGPLGMLYSTIPGAIVMFIVSVFLIFGTAGLGLFLSLPVCMFWAGIAASNTK